jgi:hypothetical protein
MRSSSVGGFLILLFSACGDDDRPAGDAGASLDGGATELDCPQVFDCVSVCADGDDPCVEACIGRGSAAALVLANAVLECADRNGCTDEDCLAASCGPELVACAGSSPVDGGLGDAGPSCESAGRPEMTGLLTGLAPSYLAGDPIEVGVPVDEDTARVVVGVYEVGSELYLGGTAEDVAGSSTATLSLFAGVAGGETGTFYLSIELCSTRVCATPLVRNTYQRADRTAPLASGETYLQTREEIGGSALPEICPSSIPIQAFEID